MQIASEAFVLKMTFYTLNRRWNKSKTKKHLIYRTNFQHLEILKKTKAEHNKR